MIKVHKGDLLKDCESRFNIIIHGCNAFCNMGAGIAAAIKRKYPEAYAADKKTVKGLKSKLGTFSFAEYPIPGQDINFKVLNCYTQYHFGGHKANCDYKAIRSCMQKINKEFPDHHIGLPKIGCGLAGGSWTKVQQIIDEELTDCTFEVWCL